MYTIFGNTGFIGSHLAKRIKSLGEESFLPVRDTKIESGTNLGNIIYCIGLTGDFRTRPHETIEAHVTFLSNIIKNYKFESLLYCSSTRIYSSVSGDANEQNKILSYPSKDSLYDLSKLLGEAICLTLDNPKVKILRLSNVFGMGQSKATFLGSVTQEALLNGKVIIHDNPESCKDYILIDDVIDLILKIISNGNYRIYNIASGINLSCNDISKILLSLGYEVNFSYKNEIRKFPVINTDRIREEFSFEANKIMMEQKIKDFLIKEKENVERK
jgi:nucleoside-diphosphate-sugar epimerase